MSYYGGPEPLAAEGRRRNLGVDPIKSRATDDFRELCIEALDARMQYRSGLLMERQLNPLAVGRSKGRPAAHDISYSCRTIAPRRAGRRKG